jgi:hypothetical protein
MQEAHSSPQRRVAVLGLTGRERIDHEQGPDDAERLGPHAGDSNLPARRG